MVADGDSVRVNEGAPARVVEATVGQSPAPHPAAEGACLNCGTALIGTHCHSCGQHARPHRTLRAFAHDLLHGVLHFEGKTWRTLRLLLWRPGKLTREYIDGRRARYVSPIAMFLFVVFLSFAAFNALGGGAVDGSGSGFEAANQAYRDNDERLAELRAQRDALAAGETARRGELNAAIDGLESDQRGLRMVVGNVGAEVTDGLNEGFARSPIPKESQLGRAIEHIRANPQLAIYKAQTNAYKFSWALIPLSVPFVWLLFAFSRQFGAYDHTVFATYSITFMIALVAVASLLLYANLGSAAGIVLLYAPVHMYRQLRGTYGVGRWGAGWRMLVLSLCAWLAIGLFASVIAMLTA